MRDVGSGNGNGSDGSDLHQLHPLDIDGSTTTKSGNIVTVNPAVKLHLKDDFNALFVQDAEEQWLGFRNMVSAKMKCFAILWYCVVFLAGLGCLILQLCFQFRMHVLGQRIKPRVIPPPRLSDLEDLEEYQDLQSNILNNVDDGEMSQAETEAGSP